MTSSDAAKTLTITISGSRTLTNYELVARVLDERAVYYLSAGYLLHLHLGDAQGVDANAIRWARERQVADRVTIFFASPDLFTCFDPAPNEQTILAADWRTDGYAAGPVRNTAMLSGQTLDGQNCQTRGCKGADVLWAVRNRAARNSGTDNTIRQAISRNIAVQTYTVGGASEWVDEPWVLQPWELRSAEGSTL